MPVAFRLCLLRRGALFRRRRNPGIARRIEVKQPPSLQAQFETQKARVVKHTVALFQRAVFGFGKIATGWA